MHRRNRKNTQGATGFAPKKAVRQDEDGQFFTVEMLARDREQFSSFKRAWEKEHANDESAGTWWPWLHAFDATTQCGDLRLLRITTLGKKFDWLKLHHSSRAPTEQQRKAAKVQHKAWVNEIFPSPEFDTWRDHLNKTGKENGIVHPTIGAPRDPKKPWDYYPKGSPQMSLGEKKPLAAVKFP